MITAGLRSSSPMREPPTCRPSTSARPSASRARPATRRARRCRSPGELWMPAGRWTLCLACAGASLHPARRPRAPAHRRAPRDRREAGLAYGREGRPGVPDRAPASRITCAFCATPSSCGADDGEPPYRLAWDALLGWTRWSRSSSCSGSVATGWPYEDRLLAELRISAAGGDDGSSPGVIAPVARACAVAHRPRSNRGRRARSGGSETDAGDDGIPLGGSIPPHVRRN